MHSDLLHLQRYHDSGDAGAFRSLVQSHASMVFNTARRVTCDASLAEDVAQETFLELARKGRTITESVAAWLHRVAWRRACDTVRAESTRRRHESAAVTLVEGRECSWEELQPVVDEAIDALAAEERTVIVEHYLEGRTQTEIAASMGISQSTVSRLLEQGMAHLRTRLKGKGLLCGAGLGGMLAAASLDAAPGALAGALAKIGLSSIGSGAAATAGGSLLLGLSFKAVLGGLLVLVACAAGYDLASQDSYLLGWLKLEPVLEATQKAKSGTEPAASSSESLATTVNQQRLLAEAKGIWARARKFSYASYRRALENIGLETDPDKRLALYRSAGFGLSRAAYDRVMAMYPSAGVYYNERRSKSVRGNLMLDLIQAWHLESPLEAVAWETSVQEGRGTVWFPAVIAPWVRDHADAWAAFVAAGPASRLGDHARLWIEDLDDPGSIWAKAGGVGMELDSISNSVFRFIESGAPADPLFRLIMRCPDAQRRSKYLMGLVPRLSSEQLHQAASSGLFPDPGLVSLLQALAGERGVSYSMASAWFNQAANGGGETAQLARWTEAVAGPFYAQWFKVDAQGALRHAMAAINPELRHEFMRACVSSPALNEAMIAAAAPDGKSRDRALAAFYEARSAGDPGLAVQKIIGSHLIMDQIENAKDMLTEWAGQSAPDAAAWAASLPEGAERTAFMTTVAFRWAQTDPEPAFAYLQKTGLPLSSNLGAALAWGARDLPEEKLAAMFALLREEPEYNAMISRLAQHRYPRQPKEAFALLARHASPGWENLVLDHVIDQVPGYESNVVDYAMQLPALDLERAEPQRVLKAAQRVVQRFARDNRLSQALDWTLKLPAGLAPAARAEAFAKLTFKDSMQKAEAGQWINRAAISTDERAALREQVRRQTLSQSQAAAN